MNIAVTGGIGCGKSVVSKILAHTLNAPLFDSDALCRQELLPKRPGLLAVEWRWGQRFLTPTGELDRPSLRKAAFDQPELLVELENILHPLVLRRLEKEMAKAKDQKTFLVAEIPLLFEVGWEKMFDYVVVVKAARQQIVTRVGKRDGRSKEDILQIVAAQMPLAEKVKKADYCIDNSGIFAASIEQVYYLARSLRAR